MQKKNSNNLHQNFTLPRAKGYVSSKLVTSINNYCKLYTVASIVSNSHSCEVKSLYFTNGKPYICRTRDLSVINLGCCLLIWNTYVICRQHFFLSLFPLSFFHQFFRNNFFSTEPNCWTLKFLSSSTVTLRYDIILVQRNQLIFLLLITIGSRRHRRLFRLTRYFCSKSTMTANKINLFVLISFYDSKQFPN